MSTAKRFLKHRVGRWALPSAFLLSASFLCAQSALDQPSPNSDKDRTVLRSNVREVLLDVVVRRKNLTLDRKLKASDFTITEDGVPQTIKTFRFVSGEDARVVAPAQGAVGPAVKTAAGHANSTREPNFVSIIFDDIGPDSRKNAEEAAADFLSQQFQENTYAAIFGLNLRLNALQTFTNDRAVLTSAVHRAVTANSQELANASANVLNQTNYATVGGQGGVSITPGLDISQRPDLSTTSASGAPLSEGQQAVAQIVTSQREMVSYGVGMRILISMLRLVQYESALPGRKTVLYLSDGLNKPPDRQDVMNALVSAANRGNISFYCVDVRGLTAGSSNGMVSGLTETAGNLSSSQRTTPDSPSAGMAQMRQMQVIQEALSAHVQLSMAELAESTGGFAVFNTNNFKGAMARVMEDVRTHYEISYVPTSSVEDASFRTINVTVKDPRLIVQSRRGYFAVPQIRGMAVAPFEMAGLRALNQPPKTDFPLHVAALRFKPLADGFRYEVVFQLGIDHLTTTVDPNTHKARIHATFLALIKDQSGQVVEKVSQDVDREVPEERIEQFRRGEMIFTSPVVLAAGRYVIEAVASDAEGGRTSTRRVSLIVPRAGEPAVSSIAVVHDVDPLTSPRDPGNPLEFAGGKIVPEVASDKKAEKDTAVFFVVYPQVVDGKPAEEKPRVSVEFFRDGKQILRTMPDVGSADEVNSFPVITSAKLPPGNYFVTVKIQQAGRQSEETTALTVNP